MSRFVHAARPPSHAPSVRLSDGGQAPFAAARPVAPRAPSLAFELGDVPARSTPRSAPPPAAGLPSPPSSPSPESPDPLEAEADQVAERALAHRSFTASAAAPRIQRARDDDAAASSAGGGGLIVDDATGALTAGQMGKMAFLAQLRVAVCAATDEALRRVGRDTRGCPYIEKWLGHYADRPAAHLERAIRKLVPQQAAAVTAARDYVPLVAARVAQGASRWAETGQIPDDVPADLRAELPGVGGVGGALAGAASALVGAVGGAVSALGRLLFKEGPGGARAGADAVALSGRLGEGRPLEGGTRARMESAFGHGFGHVRVHDDGRGAALSRDLGARAFTLGAHVAFSDGSYRPGTPAGDALLAHELAHVVQQGGGHARGAEAARGALPADDAIEADADRAAEGAVRSLHAPDRGSQGPRARPRLRGGLRLSRCPPSKPTIPQSQQPMPGATYDIVHLHPPQEGLTLDGVKQVLKDEKKKGFITSFDAEDVPDYSPRALYVLHAIAQTNQSKNWNREIDAITDIEKGKPGAITVRVDAEGHAVASVVRETAPSVAATYATADAASTDLKARFKLADVRGERGRNWKVGELNKVAAAWSQLGATEAAALEGYALIRTDALTDDAGKPRAGETTTGDKTSPDGKSSIREREMRFADLAFDDDNALFVGDVRDAAPFSKQPILHETGHAFERKLAADTRSLHREAQFAARAATEKAGAESSQASNSMGSARYSWGSLKRSDQATSKAYVTAFQAAYQAIEDFRSETDPSKTAAAKTRAHDAVAARNTARSALPPKNPTAALFATAEADQDRYLAAVDAMWAAAQAVDSARANNAAATDPADPTGKRSVRLQRFVAFVNSKGILPFTKHAQERRDQPEEFYAEAFSFWLSDPTFLAQAAPDLKRWFDAGEHLR
jgi:hypothetical protein